MDSICRFIHYNVLYVQYGSQIIAGFYPEEDKKFFSYFKFTIFTIFLEILVPQRLIKSYKCQILVLFGIQLEHNLV